MKYGHKNQNINKKKNGEWETATVLVVFASTEQEAPLQTETKNEKKNHYADEYEKKYSFCRVEYC